LKNAIAIHLQLHMMVLKRIRTMYVCICNAIRETDLRTVARCCRGDATALYGALGHAPQCGQCLDEAEDIIAEETASADAPLSAAA